MPDEETSAGVFGLLRDVISITGSFDRECIVSVQYFGIRRIFSIIRKR